MLSSFSESGGRRRNKRRPQFKPKISSGEFHGNSSRAVVVVIGEIIVAARCSDVPRLRFAVQLLRPVDQRIRDWQQRGCDRVPLPTLAQSRLRIVHAREA